MSKITSTGGFLGFLGAISFAGACLPSQSSTPVSSGGNGGGNGTCATCRHTSGGVGGNAGGSTGGSSAGSSGGSSGGLQDAGIDAGFDAGPVDAGIVWPPPFGSQICPAGSINFTGQTSTFGPCVPGGTSQDGPIGGIQVTTLEPWGATTSDDGGYFTLCVPNSVPFTTVFTAPNFATGYLAEVILNSDRNVAGNGLYLLCDALVDIFQSESSGWNFSTEGSVLVSIVSSSGQPPCDDSVNGLAGWHVQSALPDGGETVGPTGWPVGYLSASGQPNGTVTSTYSVGYAIVYNIDADLDTVTVYVDGGPPSASCPSSNQGFGFDGLVHVVPGAFGMFPYLIP